MAKSGGKGSGGVVARAIAGFNRLGVANASFLGSGMRAGDLAKARGAFAGASRAEATRIATGKAPARDSGRTLPPITLAKDIGSGRGSFHLRDGRHRLTAAREAGATRIRATVVVSRRVGGEIRESRTTRNISIKGVRG